MFRNSEQKHITKLSWIVSGWLSINISSSRFIISVQRLTAQAKLVTRCSGRLSSQYQTRLSDDPSENCHLTVKKLLKTWHFFQKNCQKFSFFSKKLPMAIFWKKMKIFCIFFGKNVKFLANFWQSNGNFPEGQVRI